MVIAMNSDTSQSNSLKVFIGSGEASKVECNVLKYSIQRFSPKCEIIIYNGTHDTLEYADGRIDRLNTPLDIKYQNVTEFSNFRWFIPEICGFQGRAIYLDSDMICFTDIGIFDQIEMDGCQIMARSDAYATKGKWGYDPHGSWALSMCLFDCETFRQTARELFDGIDAGHYTYKQLHFMKPEFTNHYGLKLCDLPAGWNDLDVYTDETKLIHYTDLSTQPWKFPGHKFGSLWHQWLLQAIDAGALSNLDVSRAITRGYVRGTIRDGNWAPSSRRPWKDTLMIAPWYFTRLRRILSSFMKGAS